MSALLPDDTFEESAIIFTPVPVLDPPLPDGQAAELVEALPDHVEFLKNKLREQQQRKQRDEAEGFVVDTKSAGEAAREQSDALLDAGPGFGDLNLEAKNGFYRLMMVLAIILPLSFIARSVISTFANPASVAQQPVQPQFDASPATVFPSAFAPVASTNP